VLFDEYEMVYIGFVFNFADTSESKVLTNEDLDAIAKCIEGSNCHSLAFELNVTKSEIETHNDTECLQKTILQVWTSKEGQNATIENLLKALRQLKDVNIKWDGLHKHFGNVVLKYRKSCFVAFTSTCIIHICWVSGQGCFEHTIDCT